MEPDAYSRAVSQLYSVLRDLGIAIRGLARYQITPSRPAPPDRGFAQHVTTSAAWLLGAWHSLDGVLAAEGLGPLRDLAGPGDVLCQAARDAITAWRQPSGTAADRDTTAGQLITAIVFLSEATLSLAGYAPRHRTIDLYAVSAGLAEARVALASAIQIRTAPICLGEWTAGPNVTPCVLSRDGALRRMMLMDAKGSSLVRFAVTACVSLLMMVT